MFLMSCSLVWAIETLLLFISSEISMNYLKILLYHPCISKKKNWVVKCMGENPSQRDILQTFFSHSYLSVPNPTNSIHISRTTSTFVLFPHYQSIHTSRTFIFALKFTYPIITYWYINSIPETRWGSGCFGVLHTFMLNCVQQYFDNVLFETFWEF